MNENLTDVLDVAAGRLMAGETLSDILADYPAHADELKMLLNTVTSLDTVRSVEMPASEDMQLDRNEFLTVALKMQPQAVSLTPMERLKVWISHYLPTLNLAYPRKEQWRMSTLLIRAAVVLGVIFGSMGGTAVYASQSLPGSPVYPLKLTMEQARIALASGPAEQANLYLRLTQVRTQEMEQMVQQGDVPDEGTLNRLQNQISQAFQLAAQLPDDQMQGVLTQAQQMLQTEEQRMAQTQAMAGEAAQEPLQQVQQFLHQARTAAQSGVDKPQAFRHSFQYGNSAAPGGPPSNEPTVEPSVEPTVEPTLEPTDEPTVEPTLEPTDEPNQYRQQNQYSQGPTGPCNEGEECDPGGPIQNQHENQYQHRQGPGEPQADPTCEGNCDPDPNANQNQNGRPEPTAEATIEPTAEPTVEILAPVQNNNGGDSGNGGNDGNDGNGGNDGDDDNGKSSDNSGSSGNGGGKK